jgi:acyl transferase domain-containing protein
MSFGESGKINSEGYYHPNNHRPGCAPTKGGYFLSEDPKQFDHGFFGVSPPEAMAMDPQQRRVLEVVYEAFENAGEPWEAFYGSKTGVFVGNFCFDHSLMQSRDLDDASPYSATGTSVSIISNRISFLLNLQGPR